MPTLAEKFQTAVDARKTLDDVAARQAEATKAYQTAAVKRFLGEHDPATEVGTILKGNNALATMSDLARKTAGNPAARAGLQKAVVDFVLRDLESNRAAGTTGTQFLKTDAFSDLHQEDTAGSRHDLFAGADEGDQGHRGGHPEQRDKLVRHEAPRRIEYRPGH